MHQLAISRIRHAYSKSKILLAVSATMLGLTLGIGSLKDGLN